MNDGRVYKCRDCGHVQYRSDACGSCTVEEEGKTRAGKVLPLRPWPDPKPRPNGTCTVCGKARPDVAVKHLDPFCSSTCARRWHRVELEAGPS